MTILEPAARAFFLGLSTGVLCIGTCAPALAPFLIGRERRSFREKLAPFLQFVFGRFVAYVLFGAALAWIGGLPGKPPLPVLIGVSYIGLSILMLLFGLTGGFPGLKLCRLFSPLTNKPAMPLLIGLLMGFNVCPPFVAAAVDVLISGRVLYGVVFFVVFFFVTTLFLLPSVFLGYLGSNPAARTIAQLAALIVGAIYLFMGLAAVFRKGV